MGLLGGIPCLFAQTGDPAAVVLDGDAAEVLTERTAAARHVLLAALQEDLEAEQWQAAIDPLSEPWRSLRPKDSPEDLEPWQSNPLRGLRFQRIPKSPAPAVSVSEWLRSMRDQLAQYGPWEHAKSKVIAVRGMDEGRFETDVLLDFWTSGKSQGWLEVRLTWDGEEACRAISGELLRMDLSKLAAGKAPHFQERTRGLLANDDRARNLLAPGGREWAARLDDTAATAWFGHQGMAVGDVNGDHLPDLYVAMPSGLPNLLLVQQSDGTVLDVAQKAGVAWNDDTKGVLLVDLDGDGDRDLVTALHHVLVLHENDGEGLFKVVGWCVAPDESPFYSIAAADVNGDLYLDLFAVRYVQTRYGESIPVPFEDAVNGPSNHLFLNRGGFKFVDQTKESGLDEGNHRFSLAASFSDFDLDGDQDLYVANDFGRNRLWRNEGGKFTDVAQALGVQDQAAGMGVDWGDVNSDGRPDLYVSNMYSSAGRRIAYQPGYRAGSQGEDLAGIQRLAQGNSLFVQNADGTFSDRSDSGGVRMGRWSWGAIFCDLNGDGAPDIYAPNGFMTGPAQGDL